MQWRNEPGGYLREILTAKVYDVAVSQHSTAQREDRCGLQDWPAFCLPACYYAAGLFASQHSIYFDSGHPGVLLGAGPTALAGFGLCPGGVHAASHRSPPFLSVCQVETPMQKAEKLSEQLGSTILLKREDLQVSKAKIALFRPCLALHGACSHAEES